MILQAITDIFQSVAIILLALAQSKTAKRVKGSKGT
jgi:hypothetical protein